MAGCDAGERCRQGGRVPAARGRAVVLRIEPLSKAHRLDPVGLPSLAQHSQAGCAGGLTGAALPVAEDRGLPDGRHGYATAICFARPLDELAGARFVAPLLRLRARSAGQIITPATRQSRSRAA